jgi:hypothetical protein
MPIAAILYRSIGVAAGVKGDQDIAGRREGQG